MHRPALRPDLALRVDADAAAILHSATQAVNLVLARRRELDRAGQADRPLVVLAGERHDVPAYILHHMLVLKGLLDAGEKKVVVADECPHNALRSLFFYVVRRKPDPVGTEKIRRLDSGGVLSLKNELSFLNDWAGYSEFSFYRFLLRRGIDYRQTDAAKIRKGENSFIDHADPLAVKSLRACLGVVLSCFAVAVNKHINTCSPKGMHVRNDHMVRRVLEFGEETGARIVFQRCGNIHVAGSTFGRKIDAGRHSLSRIFRDRSVPFFALRIDNEIPPDHGLKEGEDFLVGTLSEIWADHSFGKGAEKTGSPDPCLIDNEADEAAYVHALARRTGLKEIILSSRKREKESESARLNVSRAIFEWEYGHPPLSCSP